MDSSTRNFVIAVVLLTAIVAAILYVPQFIRNDENRLTYNGFEFVHSGELWHTQWQHDGQLYNVRLNFNPKEVEDIPLNGEVSSNFSVSQVVFLTHDPTDERVLGHLSLATVELRNVLAVVFERDIVTTCTNNSSEACSRPVCSSLDPTDCVPRPVITCDNTNAAVVYLKRGGETSISLEDNCVTIQGEGRELVRAAEKAIYLWYGII